jgi:hypothetical protein
LYTCAADLDSGARLCFIGREHYKSYIKSGGKNVAKPLDTIMKVHVANKRFEYCKSYLQESIEIPVGNGKVRVDNVIFYIIDSDWGDALVGWPVLRALGITPEQNIYSKLGQKIDMNDFEQELFGISLPANFVDILHGKHYDINTIPIMINDASWDSSLCAEVSEYHVNAAKYYLENSGTIADFEFEEIGILETPPSVEYEKHLTDILQDALLEGCENIQKLQRILQENENAYAIDFSECSVSKLSPMETKHFQ